MVYKILGLKLFCYTYRLKCDCLGHCGSDHMVVGYTTTCAINTYHHYSCEFESRSWWGLVDTTLCDKVCQ
jgi:hypothetical protein